MNEFQAALHAHAKAVFLNTDHSARVVSVEIGGQLFPEVDSQLTDIEDKDLKSRNTAEYLDNVFDVRKQLIVAIDAFGFIPVMNSQIWVNGEAFLIDWVGDREGLLYLHLRRATM